MNYEGIILCGGEGWRLKPDTWTPKPLLEISEKETVLDRQIRWLLEYNFNSIILASNRSFPESTFFTNPKVHPCIERRKLGTGGAIKRAVTLINEEKFYVMNVDDIVFCNPQKLYEKADGGAAILLAKPQMPFGRVTMQADIIKTFEHRPVVEMWANAGHYVFSKEIVRKYFLEEGDFEQRIIQQIAEDGYLKGLTNDGAWLTLNTMKDLIEIQEYFAALKNRS